MKEGVSLILTVYNEGASLQQFLDSYTHQAKHADEVIIVDGGSTDKTIDIINAYAKAHADLNVCLVVDPTCSKPHSPGPIAKGRNVAISTASYHRIAVTDAGCVLAPDWLAEIVRPFDNEGVDVVSGWYTGLNASDFQQRYERLFMPRLEDVNAASFLPSSRSIAFTVDSWRKVGGYPESTYTAEDTLFDLKMKAAGCHFVFAPKAVVRWNCPASVQETVQKYKSYAYGDGLNRLFLARYVMLGINLVIPYYVLVRAKSLRDIGLCYLVLAQRVSSYIKGVLRSFFPV